MRACSSGASRPATTNSQAMAVSDRPRLPPEVMIAPMTARTKTTATQPRLVYSTPTGDALPCCRDKVVNLMPRQCPDNTRQQQQGGAGGASAAGGSDRNPRRQRHQGQRHGIVGGEGPEELRCTEGGEKERGEVRRPAIKQPPRDAVQQGGGEQHERQ